eukprot:TRINITY_DN16622_c0_g1_i2.p1 TRINITY_DN16622_c0_g1~~TRINITY_DN16622_c0_g1_i2.p1  ORF type:complete len:322 (+),score=38.33 TRINITY_DN16622_c0_g1_i2:52-1017(+)
MDSFDLSINRYDQNTFKGRLFHFLNVIDPRTLFPKFFFGLSLNESQLLLKQYENKTLPLGVTKEKLLLAKKIKESAIHPDTGEKIPMPFRMSGFVPFGVPIVVGVLLPNPTMLSTAFWQTLNQSHNALVNYSNRNATKPFSMNTFIQSYLGAVASAVGLSLSLNALVERSTRLKPATRYFVQKFVPFPAVALAGVCNVVLMRRNELKTGIDVKDANGLVVGTSKIAAQKALFETALTRAFLPAPILICSPLILTAIEKTTLLDKFPRLRLPVTALVATLCFGAALPLAISLFPQIGSIKGGELEPDLNVSRDAVLYYNKGL